MCWQQAVQCPPVTWTPFIKGHHAWLTGQSLQCLIDAVVAHEQHNVATDGASQIDLQVLNPALHPKLQGQATATAMNVLCKCCSDQLTSDLLASVHDLRVSRL